jgi:hypothetical protein
MTQLVPGWYPDPSGKPGQKYWDGQRWVPPAGPPQNPLPASLRRRWSALRTRTKMAIIGALAVIMAFAVWPTNGGGSSPSGTPPAPSGQSAPSAPSGKSPSYMAGYAKGSAPADPGLLLPGGTRTGGEWTRVQNRRGCIDAYDDAIQSQVHPYDEDDYVEGCMQGIQDRPK